MWTLTTNGKTERAYGSLKPDYFIDDNVIMANNGAAGMGGADPALDGNKPPTLTIDGATQRTVKAGEPIALTATAVDDRIPRNRAFGSSMARSAHGRKLPRAVRIDLHFVLHSMPAITVTSSPRLSGP